MAVARGSRLGRVASAGSATMTGISRPRPWRNASASASPAKAPPQMTMLRCAAMRSLPGYVIRLRLLPDNSWAKQGRETRYITPGIAIICGRERLKAYHVQRLDRPDFHPRSRTARGEPVPGQQPENKLAAGVRRPGDRAGDGCGLPHRRGPPAAFDPLLFHPARRSADPDHLPSRT